MRFSEFDLDVLKAKWDFLNKLAFEFLASWRRNDWSVNTSQKWRFFLSKIYLSQPIMKRAFLKKRNGSQFNLKKYCLLILSGTVAISMKFYLTFSWKMIPVFDFRAKM